LKLFFIPLIYLTTMSMSGGLVHLSDHYNVGGLPGTDIKATQLESGNTTSIFATVGAKTQKLGGAIIQAFKNVLGALIQKLFGGMKPQTTLPEQSVIPRATAQVNAAFQPSPTDSSSTDPSPTDLSPTDSSPTDIWKTGGGGISEDGKEIYLDSIPLLAADEGRGKRRDVDLGMIQSEHKSILTRGRLGASDLNKSGQISYSMLAYLSQNEIAEHAQKDSEFDATCRLLIADLPDDWPETPPIPAEIQAYREGTGPSNT
jgi:hypothetical protein